MKQIVNGILVVEGSGDASFLSSFLECEIVITNGYEIPNEEIEYLRELSKDNNIIVLTDSDEAGFTIRKRLHESIDCIDAVVDIKCCNKNGKHGVAECTKNEILRVLEKYIDNNYVIIDREKLTLFDLQEVGIVNKENYLFIGKKFHIGKHNSKVLLHRLNTLKVTKEDLRKCMEEYTNGD
mgnify:CR=1 FL=1